jgi:hypothetical protein
LLILTGEVLKFIRKNQEEDNFMKIRKAISTICVILLIALPVYAYDAPEESSGQQELSIQDSMQEADEQVIASVNGENLYREQLQQKTRLQLIHQQLFQIDQKFAQFLNYSEAGQQFLEEYNRYIMNDLIDEVLLMQEADRRGIKVTEEDEDYYFEEHIENIKEQQGINEEEIVEILQGQGVDSLEQYQQIFVENTNLLVEKLTNEEIISDIEITDKIAMQIYEQNKGQFTDREGNIAPFEDIKNQLKAQIMQQEEANILEEFTQELRDNADINILF